MTCTTPGCSATATATLLILGNGRDDPSTRTQDFTASFCTLHADVLLVQHGNSGNSGRVSVVSGR